MVIRKNRLDFNKLTATIIVSIIAVYPLTFIFSDFVGLHAAEFYLGLINHEIVFTGFLLILCLLSFIINWKVREVNITKSELIVFVTLACITAWINLSSIWSLNSYLSRPEIGVWTSYLLWFMILICLSKKNVQVVRALIIQVTCVCAIFALYIIGSYIYNDGYVSYFVLNINRSIIAECLLICSFLLLGYGLNMKNLMGSIYLFISFLSMISIILIGQRAPLYAMLFMIILTVFILACKWRLLRLKIFGFGVGIIICFAIILTGNPYKYSDKHWDTVSRVYNFTQAAETFEFRINGIIVCWYQWRDRWLLGTGQGTYQMSYPLYAQHAAQKQFYKYNRRLENHQVSRAHCEPAQVAAELGTPGILLWLTLFLFYPIVFGYRAVKDHLLIPFCSCAGIIGVTISSLASSFGTRTILPGVMLISVYYFSLKCARDKTIITTKLNHLLIALTTLIVCINTAEMVAKWKEMTFFNKAVESTQNTTYLYPRSTYPYIELIKKYPDNPVYYYLLGNLLVGYGKMNQDLSVLCWEKATQLGIYSIYTVTASTHSYFINHQYSKAFQVLDKAQAIYPYSDFLNTLRSAYNELVYGGNYSDSYNMTKDTDVLFMMNAINGKLGRDAFVNYNGNLLPYMSLLKALNHNPYESHKIDNTD